MTTKNTHKELAARGGALQSKVDEMAIEHVRHLEEATTVLSEITRTLDSIKEEKEKVTKPLNEALKAERERWKPIETELEEAVRTIKKKMSDYQTRVSAEAEAERKRIADRIGEGKGKLKISTAARKIAEVAVPERKVETGNGGARFRTVRKFEVMDVTMLPVECLLPNTVVIRRLMNEGKEVAGVRYWSEEEVSSLRN